MEPRIDVIYCRFSSELQRTESNADQERRCRDGLDRLGISHAGFVLITDEAITGESDSRPGFQRVKDLIYADKLGRLVVSEQSRLSRGDNVKGLIKDVVYHGGRFISITEGIDTDRKGWKLIVGISEIHHNRSNEDTAERVRGGQEGRVLDGNGSAGDFPYGYRSEYADPEYAKNYKGRGPKPKKVVLIDEAESAVVRQIFERFVAGDSITGIVKHLNSIRTTIPRIGNRSGTGIWHHQHVRRILTNAKYIGIWVYGLTTKLSDSDTNTKQVPALTEMRESVKRKLREVPNELRQILAGQLPDAVLSLLAPNASGGNAEAQEFVLDLGGPTTMDRWAPQIVQWREQGVTWKEIVRRTGLKLANAYLAYKRHRDAGGKAA